MVCFLESLDAAAVSQNPPIIFSSATASALGDLRTIYVCDDTKYPYRRRKTADAAPKLIASLVSKGTYVGVANSAQIIAVAIAVRRPATRCPPFGMSSSEGSQRARLFHVRPRASAADTSVPAVVTSPVSDP